MRKVLLSCVVMLLVLGAAAAAWSSVSRADVPFGVEPAEWHPLSDDLGVVIRVQESGEVVGYLMTRVDAAWRIVPLRGPRIPEYLPVR